MQAQQCIVGLGPWWYTMRYTQSTNTCGKCLSESFRIYCRYPLGRFDDYNFGHSQNGNFFFLFSYSLLGGNCSRFPLEITEFWGYFLCNCSAMTKIRTQSLRHQNLHDFHPFSTCWPWLALITHTTAGNLQCLKVSKMQLTRTYLLALFALTF